MLFSKLKLIKSRKCNQLLKLFLVIVDVVFIIRFPLVILPFLLLVILTLLGEKNPPVILTLMSSATFLSLFVLILFPIRAEITGEINSCYVNFLERKNSLSSVTWTIKNYFANEPGIFYLLTYINKVTKQPFFTIKIVRLLLTVLGFFLVYILGKEIFKRESIALMAAFIFAFHYQQIFYLGGDEFKNFLGNIFFIGTILFFVKSLENEKKLIPTVFLWMTSVVCHKVYLFFFPITILAFLITNFFSCTLKFRHTLSSILGGITTFYLTIGGIMLALTISFVKIPRLEDYWGYIEGSPLGLGTFTFEFSHLGMLLFNIWAFLLIIGGIVFYKKEVLANNKVLFIFTLFIFNFLMAKNYLLGFPFIHGRFAILIPVSQALLTALFIYKITELKKSLILRFPLIATVILANFLVLVKATNGEIIKSMFLPFNSLSEYVLGNFVLEITPFNVLFSFLIIITALSVYFFIGKGLFKEKGIAALTLSLAVIITIGVFSWYLYICNLIPFSITFLIPLIVSLLSSPVYFMHNIKKYEPAKS